MRPILVDLTQCGYQKMSLKLKIGAKHLRVRELSMEKEGFSTSILRYIGRPRIKMTIIKRVN